MAFLKKITAFSASVFLSFAIWGIQAESYLLPVDCEIANATITGEFLLWQPEISGTSYAATNILTPTPFGFSLANDINFHQAEFDYKPGFRVGALYTVPGSDWTIDLYWTCFNASAFDSISASGDIVISTFWEQPGVIRAATASSEVSVDLQNVDLNIGKTIDVFGCFSLRPYVGATYYKLYVDNDIEYIGTIDALPAVATFAGKLSDHSTGFGLSIGSNALWKLPYNFGIYGKGSYSIYRSTSDNSIAQTTTIPSASTELALKSKNKFSILNQLIKASFGIQWDYFTCIHALPLNVSLFAGYELNYFPNQIELKRAQFSGSSTSVIPLDTSGDVGFHGLSAGLSLAY